VSVKPISAESRPSGRARVESLIPLPKTPEETELPTGFLADLTLKLIYYKSDMSSMEISDTVALPFVGVMERILEFLKREELVEITGSKGFGERVLPPRRVFHNRHTYTGSFHTRLDHHRPT
jgi:hypothetical protein